jgi:hypothetical protein
MTRPVASLAILALALAACATPAPTTGGAGPISTEPEPRPARPLDPEEDVRLGGESLVGTWSAIEIDGDEAATRDLGRGIMEQTLIIRRRGQAILTGHDRRDGTGEPVTFGGTVRGDLLMFEGLSGAARLTMRGRRLLVHDPRGRVVVFARVGR